MLFCSCAAYDPAFVVVTQQFAQDTHFSTQFGQTLGVLVQVTACTAGQSYAVNVYSGTNIESQVIFSISTGCWGANADNSTLSSLSFMTGADSSGDTAYAAQAGIPLPTTYTPIAAVASEDPLNTNPCLGQDAGFYNGLTSTFYADVYASDSNTKDNFPLDFSGTGRVTR